MGAMDNWTSSPIIKQIENRMHVNMRYILSGGFWSNLNFITSSLLALLLSVAFAHFIPKDIYGVYQYILSLAAIFTSFSLTGINSSITRSVARGYEGSLIQTISSQLKWGSISTIITLLAAGYYILHDSYTIGISLLCVAIFLPISNTANTYSPFFIGKQDFKRNYIFTNIFNILYTLGMFVVIISTKNPVAITLSYFLITSVIHTILLIKTIQISKPNDLVDEDTLPYAKHLSFMNIIGVFANKIDSVLVFHFLGATNLALYSFAKIIPEKIGGALKSFASIAFPKFAEKDKFEINSTLIQRTLIFLLLTALISLGYTFIAPIVFKVFLPNYIESIPYSQILSFSLLGSTASIPVYALMSQKSTKEMYILNTAYPTIQLISIVLMMYTWGIWGLIYSKIISNILYVGMSTYLAYIYTQKNTA